MWQNTSVLVAGKKKKEGEDGESHMILLVFPQKLVQWKSFLMEILPWSVFI